MLTFSHTTLFLFAMAASRACDLQTNPDISGIGVRHSFYIQSLALLPLLFLNSGRRALAALQIFLWTSFGLTVAAVVAAILGTLSFLQAVQVSNLIWLTNFSSFLALLLFFRKNRSPASPNYSIRVAAIAHNLVSSVLTLIMWIDPARFFAQRECVQDVQYAIFVVRILAKGPLRIACLTVTSFLFLAYLVFALYELRSLYALYRTEEHQTAELDSGVIWRVDLPMPATAPHSNPYPIRFHVALDSQKPYILTLAPSTAVPSRTTSYSDISERQSHVQMEKLHWGGDHPRKRRIDPFVAGIVISYISATGYFMGSTDAMARNPHVDAASMQWGFGQILALVVVIPAVMSVCTESIIALKRRNRTRRQVHLVTR